MLSKSRYISGLQCHKRLWLQKNRPDLIPPIDASSQARFDVGNQIGKLAQSLFLGGKEVPFPLDRNFPSMVKTTQDYLEQNLPYIYEAAFIEEGVLVLCDILVRTEKGFDCYEVKSSTTVKDYHISDAAIQYYVLQKAGINVRNMYVLNLNSNYYKEGDTLDLKALFKAHDITEKVLKQQLSIPENLEAMKATLLGEEPEKSIGMHCTNPFPCEFKAYCWPELPRPNVFDIPRINNERAWAFYNEGKVELSDLEKGDVKGNQEQYVQIQLSGAEQRNFDKIDAWLSDLQFPLYFLDFETIMPALPLWPGTRPFQPHYAVQYSLHVLKDPGAELEHFEYLANFSEDWRTDIALSLLSKLGSEGTILAYNESFEKACIQRLMDWVPERKEALASLQKRFKDLITPFAKGWWIKAEMGGSTSIKSVYPTIVPNSEHQYRGLTINNGGDASRELLRLAKQRINPTLMEDQALRKDLLAYCELDTLAMVEIYRKLIR